MFVSLHCQAIFLSEMGDKYHFHGTYNKVSQAVLLDLVKKSLCSKYLTVTLVTSIWVRLWGSHQPNRQNPRSFGALFQPPGASRMASSSKEGANWPCRGLPMAMWVCSSQEGECQAVKKVQGNEEDARKFRRALSGQEGSKQWVGRRAQKSKNGSAEDLGVGGTKWSRAGIPLDTHELDSDSLELGFK